jgi:Caspase domain/TIR domain
MGNEEHAPDSYNGPAYALVIGIKEYEHGREPGQVLEDHEFPNLKVADKDALDFANFLLNYKFISYNVRVLINDEAQLANIRDEFEILRRNCKQSGVENPLVIVYFSGHGWADADGRNYLIPYEARRNKLYSTALLSRDFSLCLDDLDTNRLVVFLDACQAGTVGEEGVKGAYDFHRDLGPSDGRYVIASCGPNQKSYEWKEKDNSIFTGRLLELLKCETNDFDNLEFPEVDISDLYPVLRDKVVATAQKEYGAAQEPEGEIKGRKGIILAINERVSDRRQQKSDEETVRVFLDLIVTAIAKNSRSGPKSTMATRLKSYVYNQDKSAGYDEFYGTFDDQLSDWKEKGDAYSLEEGCNLLFASHGFASGAATSRKPKTQEPAAPPDSLVTADKSGTGFQNRSTLAKDLGQTITPPRTLERRTAPLVPEARSKRTNSYNVRMQAVSGNPIKPPRTKVFISYSREDKRYLKELRTMIAPLIQEEIIDLWDDSKIGTGADWKNEIDKALAAAKVAVLLVSDNFLASTFIKNNELPTILNAARDEGVKICWIKVSACLADQTPIGKFQAAHDPKRPLDQLNKPDRKQVLEQIAEEIKDLVSGA